MAKDTERIEIEIILDDGSVKKGFANLKRKAKGAGKDVEKSLTKSFDNIEAAAFKLGAAFAVALSIGRVANDFINFERALAGVAKTTDLSGKSLEVFGLQIQELSTRIPVSANELLRLSEVAGQFGVRGSANLLKFTETVAKLQFTIEGIDAETAAQSLTRILNVTKQGVGDVDKLSSALVQLGNTFEANEGQILQTANEVTRATAQFGISAQDALGISAALQAVGAKAQGSGTAVGKAFSEIAKAIGKGGKQLKEFEKIIGLSGKALETAFAKDSIGVFKRLVKGLSGISNNAVVTTRTLETLGLSAERVKKSLIPLAQTYEKLDRAITDSNVAFEKNIALNQEFDRVNKTTKAAIERLKNETTNLSTALGTILAPALRENISLLTDLARGAGRILKIAFGSESVKALEVNARGIERVSSELNRLRINREKLLSGESNVNPESIFGQTLLKRNAEDAAVLTARFIALNEEKNKLLGKENEGVAAADAFVQSLIGNSDEEQEEETPEAEGQIRGVGDAFGEVHDGMNEQIASLAKNARKGFKDVGKSAVNGIGKAAGGAFASFGKALANGENGFKAFAGAILQGFAQVAIQLGTQFLLTGIAYKFSGIPDLEAKSGGLIAAGAALATFGGALSALGGGGGEGSSGAGGDAFSDSGTFAEDEEIGEELVEEKTTKVAINVEGTVLDPQTVGNQIAQILNDTFEAGGTKVVTA